MFPEPRDEVVDKRNARFERWDGSGESGPIMGLVPSVLLVTVPAVHGSTLCRLERNFRLLSTVGTGCFVHGSGTEI